MLPALVVCVYYRKGDLLEITNYIMALDKVCQIYLRHYSDNQTETVCYAVQRGW